LRARLGDAATIVHIDDYFRDLSPLAADERDRRNFDTPDAIDVDLLREQLTALKKGLPVQRPNYDFATHCRQEQTDTLCPNDTIIVEGIFALVWKDLLPLYDVKVFVNANSALCLERRIARDTTERGRTEADVILQYYLTVRPMCERHVLPTMRNADIVVSGEANVDDALKTLLHEPVAQAILRHAAH
jgi:uridine kinase